MLHVLFYKNSYTRRELREASHAIAVGVVFPNQTRVWKNIVAKSRKGVGIIHQVI